MRPKSRTCPLISGGYTGSRRVGMDGFIYAFYRNKGKVKHYELNNGGTPYWKDVLGAGFGSCDDGTPALDCALNLQDVFVSATGLIYFVDSGMIRTLDVNGNVQTIAGRVVHDGDGGKLESACFGKVRSIARSNAGALVVLDNQSLRFRAFSEGTSIETIAGTGANTAFNFNETAKSQPILIFDSGTEADFFAMEPVSGDIYYNRDGYRIARLDHQSGHWKAFNCVPGGGQCTNYYN
ncbi:MAG TPA: hypothetical protein EYN66_10445, partial [Myxococcales bacterium]|nr:hypothetical protein [Myxococcales bacterium]